MSVQLPIIRNDKELPIPHFPAPYQCVIFRNWGLIPAERIAHVLQTNIETVRRCAVELGLPEFPATSDCWNNKGYITIIRYNWHLLSYEDICVLLDWPMERLAYTLKEDDFLDVKLGTFKPKVPDYRYRPLSIEEQAETARIAKITQDAYARISNLKEQPFDFVPHFRMYGGEQLFVERERFEERYIYSYCAVYGDTLLEQDLLDESFPDELLEAYAAIGITGVWIQIVLYTVVPYPFDSQVSNGWEQRQKGMKYLTEKLAKYGLKLFLYFNEPRAMLTTSFDGNPNIKGVTEGTYSTLCIQTPEVQNYIRSSVAMLAENVPLLGGFFTITASENLTNCHSHLMHRKETTCPRCMDKSYADSFALVNRLVWEGVSSVTDTMKVIAFSWAWNHLGDTYETIDKLPQEVALMNVSEQGVVKLIEDTPTSVFDYSISIEGPGEYALDTWRYAHQKGHKKYAKLQMNNSWEMAAVPYLPVFEKAYRHMKRLVEAGESAPNGLMLSWTQGGYPSLLLKFLSEFYEDTDRVPDIETMYERVFGKEHIAILSKAFHLFSEAFDKFPFDSTVAYVGPQEHAPANLLYEEPTGFEATMTGFPYDDLEWWRARFPRTTFMCQLRKMSEEWHEGAELIRELCETSDDVLMRELWDCVEACDCHFRSMYLQCQYVCLRDGYDTEDPLEIADVLKEEASISLRVANIQARNATIGYESANHYFYYQNVLVEKIISCDYLLRRLNGVDWIDVYN